MWVGSKSYPTIDTFIREVRKLGVCKRIGKVLHMVKPGRTKVYLAHDEGLVGNGFIFGYFIIARIEILVQDLSNLPFYFTRRCTAIGLADIRDEPERECGWRDEPGSIYLTSGTDINTLKRIAKREGVKRSTIKGGFIAISPVKYSGKRFRGALMVSGEELLKAEPAEVPSIEYPKPDKPRKWAKSDDKELRRLILLRGETPVARIIAEYALATGHEKNKVSYRYLKLGI